MDIVSSIVGVVLFLGIFVWVPYNLYCAAKLVEDEQPRWLFNDALFHAHLVEMIDHYKTTKNISN